MWGHGTDGGLSDARQAGLGWDRLRTLRHIRTAVPEEPRELRERVKKMKKSRVYVIVGSQRGCYITGHDLQYVSSPERDLVPEGRQPMQHHADTPPTHRDGLT
ncbi:hypothetical protein GBF38_017831 [Nibea albiflora]|uniref:Uncharacterized protein n=1 Tax=Nibea albiflora TaxID=240163 RepID=A0ACB7F553_NIBAL|nr:hypothetical protein GBF38_017831 [Nibea albiflora]